MNVEVLQDKLVAGEVVIDEGEVCTCWL